MTSVMTMRSMATTAAGAEPQAAALVREPTDLSLPEEDVLIKGGTGENEVINGVYFKLMHTFGVKAFKMVKQTGFYTAPVVRYLYWDHVSGAWTISPKSGGPTKSGVRVGRCIKRPEKPERVWLGQKLPPKKDT
eukprot:g2727.t1